MASDHDRDAEPEREQRLLDVLDAYLQALESGQAPDRNEWLGRYPDLADELTRFLDEQDRLMRLTEPLRPLAAAVSLHAVLDEATSESLSDRIVDGRPRPRRSVP